MYMIELETQIFEESGFAPQPEIGPPHALDADRVVWATWLLLWGIGTWLSARQDVQELTQTQSPPEGSIFLGEKS